MSSSNSDQRTVDPVQIDNNISISIDELIYGASSFHAIVKPVSLTMLLSSLSVIYINTEQSKAMGEEALGVYQAFTISEDASSATSLGLSLVNALIIVAAIGAMTFVIVLLYKYRCMKCLLGYMCLATTVLLMFLGGNMFTVAINKYHLSIDKISYWFTMYNFACVGTLAIFYQKGISTIVSQGYLIANSTIVAWQLSYFNDWMAWSLLIMLALYDLFAVLSPCVPLKALVNLMSKKDAPAMPGLLYEAELPQNATRPGHPKKQKKARTNSTTTETEGIKMGGSANMINDDEQVEDADQVPIESVDADPSSSRAVTAAGLTALHGEEKEKSTKTESSALTTPATAKSELVPGDVVKISTIIKQTSDNVSSAEVTKNSTKKRKKKDDRGSATSTITMPLSTEYNNSTTSQVNDDTTTQKENLFPVTLPLAIAKVYKLSVSLAETVAADSSIDISHPKAYLQQDLNPCQLQIRVDVQFPQGGGKIEATMNEDNEPRYLVYDRNGELKRTLLVNELGKVMEQKLRIVEEKGGNNIKLGLGDFIFYSVLVSKAADNGFAAFVACFLSILTGLGGTLVLLAVYHRALPALPISIFLAVLVFVLTIYCMEPWIQQLWQTPFYV